MSRALTFADLAGLIAAQRRTVRVELPEMGGHVYVREMTVAERDQYEACTFLAPPEERIGYRVGMLLRTVCDEQGTLLFDAPGLVEALPATVGQRLFDAAIELNRITAKDVAELERGCEAVPRDG